MGDAVDRLLPDLGREDGATASWSQIRAGRSPPWGSWVCSPIALAQSEGTGAVWFGKQLCDLVVAHPTSGGNLTKSWAALVLLWKGTASVATLRAAKWPPGGGRAIHS